MRDSFLPLRIGPPVPEWNFGWFQVQKFQRRDLGNPLMLIQYIETDQKVQHMFDSFFKVRYVDLLIVHTDITQLAIKWRKHSFMRHTVRMRSGTGPKVG